MPPNENHARIVLFGQARFGAEVLEGLLARGYTVDSVCMPESGGADEPLAAAASAHDLRLLRKRSYRGQEAAAEVSADKADLAVLAFVTQIIPLDILDAPRLGSLCFHPSLLPAYRGGSAIPWQLIRGETRGGVTLFRPDAGVDTGPIVLRRELEIEPDASAGAYYYSAVFDAGVQATLDAVDLVVGGRAEPAVQDEAVATHDPLCRDEHAGIDWRRPTAELHNLVRGCDPSPGAHCLHGDTVVRLFGSRRGAGHGTAGQILRIDEHGIEVATADGSLLFGKARAGAGKAAAAAVATELGLELGTILGSAVPLP